MLTPAAAVARGAAWAVGTTAVLSELKASTLIVGIHSHMHAHTCCCGEGGCLGLGGERVGCEDGERREEGTRLMKSGVGLVSWSVRAGGLGGLRASCWGDGPERVRVSLRVFNIILILIICEVKHVLGSKGVIEGV